MTSHASTLLLASASPRRRELLTRVGYELTVVAADVDETPNAGELPAAYVVRVAQAKARAVAISPGQHVLAADTIVTVDDAILGKPADRDDARAMLTRLAGRTHQVLTAVVLRSPHDEGHFTVATAVTMVGYSEALIEGYLACGEWQGKAGAYAVQGVAAALVAELRGSVTNVIGLPLAECVVALTARGLPPNLARGVAA